MFDKKACPIFGKMFFRKSGRACKNFFSCKRRRYAKELIEREVIMPIFEFKCGRCGHIYEELVLSGEEEALMCPECKSKKVNRLISRTGAVGKSSAGTSRGVSSSSCGGGAFT